MEDLVSIITPSYNSEKYVSSTIKSVLGQTYTNWEMIIVDDCSTDNSYNIIESYTKSDKRIKLYTLKKNSGAAVARNTAINKALGRFIAFLDADDLWHPDKLEKQITFIKEHNHAFVYSYYSLINEAGEDYSKELKFPSKVNYYDMLRSCHIGCLTVLLDRDKFSDIELPNIRRGQDYALWLKLLKEIDYSYCVNHNLAKYRLLANSLSRNKFKKAIGQWKIYRKIEKLSFLFSLYNMIFYVYYGIRKNKV